MRVSHQVLKALAAAIWFVGAGVLLFKGGGYLLAAADTGPVWPPIVAGAGGLAAGLLRGRTMFLRACRRNLRRIDALERPRVWQFYRPWFFAALAVMIAGGAALALLARTGYWGEVVVGGLELIIGTALLTSSVAFLSPGPRKGRPRSPGPADRPSQYRRSC